MLWNSFLEMNRAVFDFPKWQKIDPTLPGLYFYQTVRKKYLLTVQGSTIRPSLCQIVRIFRKVQEFSQDKNYSVAMLSKQNITFQLKPFGAGFQTVFESHLRGVLVLLMFCKILVSARFCGVCAR